MTVDPILDVEKFMWEMIGDTKKSGERFRLPRHPVKDSERVLTPEELAALDEWLDQMTAIPMAVLK